MFFRYFVNDLESGPELEQFVDQVVSLGSLTVLVSIPSPSLICLRVSCVYIVSVHDIHVYMYLPICCQLIFQHNLLWPDYYLNTVSFVRVGLTNMAHMNFSREEDGKIDCIETIPVFFFGGGGGLAKTIAVFYRFILMVLRLGAEDMTSF